MMTKEGRKLPSQLVKKPLPGIKTPRRANVK